MADPQPVMDIVIQRMPQTLGLLAWPMLWASDCAADRRSIPPTAIFVFDQAGTFVSMIGFSIPPFFTGPLLIVIFSVILGWFPRSMTPHMLSQTGPASKYSSYK